MKQTAIYKLNPTIEQERHLHTLCFAATKLYNTDNWMRKDEWQKTGKIPSVYTQKKLLKVNPWFKLLPSQTAQEIIFSLQYGYNSWFKKRKEDSEARPPGFRKKDTLSPISFYQQFKFAGDKIRLSMSRTYSKENKIKFIVLDVQTWKQINGVPKFCQIIFEKGNWFAHIVCEVPEPKVYLNENVMAIDIGIINSATTVDSNGSSNIYSGKQILAIQHYFNKEKAKLQGKLTAQYPKRKWSNAIDVLQKKQNRQITQALHTYSKSIITDCKQKQIKTLIVGDLKNITKDRNWGHKGNQKLHSWSFSKFTHQLEYKAIQAGMRFVRVNERYTSQKCSVCGTIKKSNRKTRGQYHCKLCGNKMNADVNGATNILKMYLRDFLSRSIGNVALPSVTRLKNVVPC